MGARNLKLVKFIKLVVPILLISFLFSGCSFHISSSLDELITPISPFGEDAKISEALDDYAKKYTLKTCINGNYTSSFVKKDLNGDGKSEAIVFYEPSDALGTVNMALLAVRDGKWQVTSSIVGKGSDVSEISFCDLTGNGQENILVSWEVISNNSNYILSIYSYSSAEDGFELSVLNEDLSFSKYTTADLNNDNLNEVLIFNTPSSDSGSSSAVLYSFKNNAKKKLGSTKLDSNITSYSNITVDKSDDNGAVVYADAVKGQNSMITEIVYWSDKHDTIISPFYDYKTGVTKETYRSNTITCRDIDGDKSIEIPMDCDDASVPSQLKLINWKTYGNYVLFHKQYSVLNDKDGYFLSVDDKVFKNTYPMYDEKNRELTVKDKENDKILFSLKTVFKAEYSEDAFGGYQMLYEKAPFCYLVSVQENEYDISYEYIKQNFTEY